MILKALLRFLRPTLYEGLTPFDIPTAAIAQKSVMDSERYRELAAKESKHWDKVQPDPKNPQIWHDQRLFEIFFGSEYRHLLERAVACGPNVLELGCGEGNLAIELAQRSLQVTAIDLSPARIERAQAKARQLRLAHQPKFLVGDLNAVTLPAEAFDCAVAHDSLHHVMNVSRLCDEVRKSLRPTGSFLVMDFIGMGPVRKAMAAILYAILPTYQPYRMKWNLRRRLPAFLAGEQRKRKALECGSSTTLHPDSPFEEISQASILEEIARRLTIVELRTFCPFWYYLAAKVRLPRALKYPVAEFLHGIDAAITRFHLAKGAYFFLEARNTQL